MSEINMKALTPDQVKRLLAMPERRRGGQTGKRGIDTSVRDHATWFKLAHKLFDEESRESAKCENPNCPDTRPSHVTIVAEVDNVRMCRICFLAGWSPLAVISGQQEIDL